MYYIMNSGIRIYPSFLLIKDHPSFIVKEYDPHTNQEVEVTCNKITLHDIAHHLAKEYRYGGSLPLGDRYSVALHSMYLSTYALEYWNSEDLARCLLMHDASEAYLGDVVTDIKRCLPDYKVMEKLVQDKINKQYHINADENSLADTLDKRILIDEVMEMVPKDKWFHFTNQVPVDRLGILVQPDISETQTYKSFLWMCEKLGIKE